MTWIGPHRRGRLLPPVLLALCIALLAACGGGEERPPEPLIMKPAPAEPGTKIDLDRPRDSSGAFTFSQWPRACGLLTDADIKVVLPQVTRVDREPEDQEITLLPEISNDVVPLPPRTVTAKGANCRYQLELPAAGLIDEKYGTVKASLQVNVDFAGKPEAVKQNFSVPRSRYKKTIEVPEGSCYGPRDGAGVSCRKGSLSFSIISYFDHLVLGEFNKYGDGKDRGGGWTDRYRVNGTTITFRGAPNAAADVSENNRREASRRDYLDVELAKTVLAKVRAGS